MKKASLILIFLSAICLSACAQLSGLPELKPWVASYDKEMLHEPYMNFNDDPLSKNFRNHIRKTHEEGIGGHNMNGGGCGCR